MKPAFTAIALVLAAAGCTSQDAPVASAAAPEAAAPANEATPEAIAAESARLNAWFDQKFAEAVARSPISQTYLGIKDNYGEWDDVSDANALKELEFQRADIAEMKAGFNPALLDHHICDRRYPCSGCPDFFEEKLWLNGC